MSFFDMFRSKTPAEQLRENKRMIDRSMRELDRERMKFEAQEKKTVAEMKKLAKAGQKVIWTKIPREYILISPSNFRRTPVKFWQRILLEIGPL